MAYWCGLRPRLTSNNLNEISHVEHYILHSWQQRTEPDQSPKRQQKYALVYTCKWHYLPKNQRWIAGTSNDTIFFCVDGKCPNCSVIITDLQWFDTYTVLYIPQLHHATRITAVQKYSGYYRPNSYNQLTQCLYLLVILTNTHQCWLKISTV